jgi:hypothetical protein
VRVDFVKATGGGVRRAVDGGEGENIEASGVVAAVFVALVVKVSATVVLLSPPSLDTDQTVLPFPTRLLPSPPGEYETSISTSALSSSISLLINTPFGPERLLIFDCVPPPPPLLIFCPFKILIFSLSLSLFSSSGSSVSSSSDEGSEGQ